ncbi:MAG: hypothetical protein LH614_06905 [Pyrinomonadaceae bacterium]|nr:hypothetical protein [Pyrinomonadaceae bacterium]
MKNRILIGRTFMSAALLVFALAIAAAAQPENFRVGETVETNDGRVCKILSITGRSAKVACGANRSDVRIYSFESMTSEAAAAAKREQQERQRQNALNTPPRPTMITFKTGDTVQTPDGRTGKIESFKNNEMAKVQFAPNETNYFMLRDLKLAGNSAKPTFKTGDTVVSPKSPNGAPGRIESFLGSFAKIRFGSGKYDFVNDLLENLMTPQEAAAQREFERQDEAQKPLRAQFEDETRQFLTLVRNLAHAYNPKYSQREITSDDRPATFERWRKELEALAAVCQKYPNMTNPAFASKPPYDTAIDKHPADWCKLAEQRTAVITKTRLTGYDFYAAAEVESFVRYIDEAIANPEGSVNDEMQMLLFERAAWEQKHLQTTSKRYAGAGVKMPPEIIKPLDAKVAELKAKIEKEAPTRSWTQPNFKDAALEASARSRYAANVPGTKVFKTGMTYTTWVARDDKSYIGDGIYRITPGAYRFKLGLALIQIPNRPFCQIRDFQVTQHRAGAGYGAAKASVGSTGIFVKCP